MQTPVFEHLVDRILAEGIAVIDDFLPADLVSGLRSEIDKRHTDGHFLKAGIGSGAQLALRNDIRGDEVLWLDPQAGNKEEQRFLALVDDFVAYLNRYCYLGIADHEFHYALYPQGAFYKRHLDRFKNDSRRKMTIICYLNQHWSDTDGGQLAVYMPSEDGQEEMRLVAPLAGRLVCFESDKLEHEVLPCHKPRYSVTGWLRTR